MRDLYSNQIIQSIPRLLSHMDRNPYSKTYGSCTRQYWHLRFDDTPNSQHQEMALTLALAHNYKYPNNIYFQDKQIREWAIAGMIFWASIQNKNGSFNEVYKNQDSFAATAFTSYSISQTYLELKQYLHPKEKEKILRALKKAGKWLSITKESIAVNQVFGAIAALYNIYYLTKIPLYLKASKNKLAKLAAKQSKEGWFNEYNGADIGYTSISIYYLAKYWQISKDKAALTIAKNMINFLKYFLQADGSVGGNFGSRNTEYLIPDGFEVFSKVDKEALNISNYILSMIKIKKNIFIEAVDDRYLSYLSWAYLQSYNDFHKRKNFTYSLPNHHKAFPQAGLISIKNKNYHLITNLKKGGVFKILSPNMNYIDSGIIATYQNTLFSSQHLGPHKIIIQDNKFITEGNLNKISPFKTSFLKVFLIKFYNLMAPPYFRRKFLDILRKKVVKGKETSIKFQRSLTISDHKIIIEDKIKGKINFNSLIIETKPIKAMYFASTLFFQNQELNYFKQELPDLSNELLKNGKAFLKREIIPNQGKCNFGK